MRISDWSSDVCSSDLIHTSSAGWARPHHQKTVVPAFIAGTHRRWHGDALLRLRQMRGQGIGSRGQAPGRQRSEEHTSELQSLMRISYAVFCLKKKKTYKH